MLLYTSIKFPTFVSKVKLHPMKNLIILGADGVSRKDKSAEKRPHEETQPKECQF